MASVRRDSQRIAVTEEPIHVDFAALPPPSVESMDDSVSVGNTVKGRGTDSRRVRRASNPLTHPPNPPDPPDLMDHPNRAESVGT